MPKTMEQLTAAHTGKVLQELRNLIINFEQNSYGMGEGGKAFLEFMEKKPKPSKAPKLLIKSCPKCEKSMFLYPGDSNDSHWVCRNCRFSIYEARSPERVIKEENKNG